MICCCAEKPSGLQRTRSIRRKSTKRGKSPDAAQKDEKIEDRAIPFEEESRQADDCELLTLLSENWAFVLRTFDPVFTSCCCLKLVFFSHRPIFF